MLINYTLETLKLINERLTFWLNNRAVLAVVCIAIGIIIGDLSG